MMLEIKNDSKGIKAWSEISHSVAYLHYLFLMIRSSEEFLNTLIFLRLGCSMSFPQIPPFSFFK